MRDWRVVFTFGIVAGAAIYALAFQSGLVSSGLYQPGTTGELREVGGFTIWLTEVQPWRLFVGGVLAGSGPSRQGLYLRSRRLWRRLGLEDVDRRRDHVSRGGDRNRVGRPSTGGDAVTAPKRHPLFVPLVLVGGVFGGGWGLSGICPGAAYASLGVATSPSSGRSPGCSPAPTCRGSGAADVRPPKRPRQGAD